MKETLISVGAWLKQNRPEYHDALLPPATPAQLDEFAEKAGVHLPQNFRTLYEWHNGQPENWDGDGIVFGDYFLSLNDTLKYKLELDEINRQNGQPGWWHDNWVPFIRSDGGAHTCLNTPATESGNSEELFHFWLSNTERPLLHNNLHDWITSIHRSMQDGTYEYDDIYM